MGSLWSWFSTPISPSSWEILSRRELIPGAGIISIDGIDLKDFDFIDIGQELPDAKAVPVVIKSLIFRHTEHGRGHHQQH